MVKTYYLLCFIKYFLGSPAKMKLIQGWAQHSVDPVAASLLRESCLVSPISSTNQISKQIEIFN